MPIDIQLIRSNTCQTVRESQQKRFADHPDIDQLIELDKTIRQSVFHLDEKRREGRTLSKGIASNRKAKQPSEKLEKELKELKLNIKAEETALDSLMGKRNDSLNAIGNIVHGDVYTSKDEEDNPVIRQWGDITKTPNTPHLYHHHELLYKIGGYEPEKGAAIAGHRGYFLTGPGVLLNMALQSFGMQFLVERGYTAVQPPYFMNKAPMAQTCQLSQFDEELYSVHGEKSDCPKYLIATSEQPISALHRNEWIHPKALPKMYAGISTCFRKEAGAHGKDAWGIFRVHQFEKIEQFVYSSPEKSWEMHEKMLTTAEEFYQKLNLPYRIVSIVSGGLNNAAAKKYDLEAHFPTLNRYRELVSCSNCTDYQSRALGIRFGQNSNKKNRTENSKQYVHLLNSTLCATTRTICCILENYQTEEGVIIPEALRPFCGNKAFIPFVRELPKPSKAKALKSGLPSVAKIQNKVSQVALKCVKVIK